VFWQVKHAAATKLSTSDSAIVRDGQFTLSPDDQQRQQAQLSRYREAQEVDEAGKAKAAAAAASPILSLREALEHALPAGFETAAAAQQPAAAPQFDLPPQPAAFASAAPPRRERSDDNVYVQEKNPFRFVRFRLYIW
jgi:hypothetical protein